MVVNDALRVNGRSCGLVVAVDLLGVRLSTPRGEVQVVLSAEDLRLMLDQVREMVRLMDLPAGKWRRSILLQGGGVTSKTTTARKMQGEGYVVLESCVKWGRSVREFGLDPARVQTAVKYRLTAEGEKLRHMLECYEGVV